MKIARIRKLILERKRCVILTSNMKTQWIGGRDWLARVDDGLRITAESIKGLFDLDVNQAEKLIVEEMPLESYPLWPVVKRDMNKMKPVDLDIGNLGGVDLLTYQNAVYLVEKKYIKAMVETDDYKEFLLGWDAENNPVILVHDGFIMAGVVRPMSASVCNFLLNQMAMVGCMAPGGTHKPENNGPDPSQAQDDKAETGIQIDMEDFREADNGGAGG